MALPYGFIFLPPEPNIIHKQAGAVCPTYAYAFPDKRVLLELAKNREKDVKLAREKGESNVITNLAEKLKTETDRHYKPILPHRPIKANFANAPKMVTIMKPMSTTYDSPKSVG
jgi:hypothetical protein